MWTSELQAFSPASLLLSTTRTLRSHRPVPVIMAGMMFPHAACSPPRQDGSPYRDSAHPQSPAVSAHPQRDSRPRYHDDAPTPGALFLPRTPARPSFTDIARVALVAAAPTSSSAMFCTPEPRRCSPASPPSRPHTSQPPSRRRTSPPCSPSCCARPQALTSYPTHALAITPASKGMGGGERDAAHTVVLAAHCAKLPPLPPSGLLAHGERDALRPPADASLPARLRRPPRLPHPPPSAPPPIHFLSFYIDLPIPPQIQILRRRTSPARRTPPSPLGISTHTRRGAPFAVAIRLIVWLGLQYEQSWSGSGTRYSYRTSGSKKSNASYTSYNSTPGPRVLRLGDEQKKWWPLGLGGTKGWTNDAEWGYILLTGQSSLATALRPSKRARGCRASAPVLSGSAGAALEPPLTPTSVPFFPPTSTTAHAIPRVSPVLVPRRARGIVWGALDGARGEGRGQGRRNVVWTQCSRGRIENPRRRVPHVRPWRIRRYRRHAVPKEVLRGFTLARCPRRCAIELANVFGAQLVARARCCTPSPSRSPPPQLVCVPHTWTQAVALLGRHERAAAAVLGERREYVHPQRPAHATSDPPLAQTATHRPPFFTSISLLSFTPLRLVSANPPQSAPLTEANFREPAFYSPLTSLRIMHPRIPFWPVDLKLLEELAADAPMPISSGDVLVALHRAQADWEILSKEDQEVVTKRRLRTGAAWRRCGAGCCRRS
ncbi:hypothetical protein DFH09DRAFT_1291054 [Mycena vulgaris]|nr:hypothetical protein DFH09DRAFT_1291054 [Mycena vulgaris]